MSDRRPVVGPLASTADVRAIRAWLDAHTRDLAEAPLWREFRDNPSIRDRLRLLLLWVERKPSQRGRGIRVGHPANPARLRATLMVAYLRGVFTSDDLEPIDVIWSWVDISALALEVDPDGEDGWACFRDPDVARPSLRAAIARGDLDIPKAPPALREQIDGFLAGLAGVSQ